MQFLAIFRRIEVSAGYLSLRSGFPPAPVRRALSKHRPPLRPAAPGSSNRSSRGAKRMSTGTVKWFNAQKGYGFIQPDEGGKDVFVNSGAGECAGMKPLREAENFSYELTQDGRPGRSRAVGLAAL